MLFGTPPEVVLPWWRTEATLEECYHSSTHLPDGRLSIIIDPGAYTNLCGKIWARKQAAKAIAAGHQCRQTRMSNPLQVQGVGHGTQTAEWQTTLPIAVPANAESSTLHAFEAPTLDGTGEELPALLGLKSIQSKRGVLETDRDGPFLTFPGPGGYKIEWAPGAIRLPLQQAPSGHLVLVTDAFGNLQSSGGIAPPSLSLLAKLENEGTEQPPMSVLDPASSSSSSGSVPANANAVADAGPAASAP